MENHQTKWAMFIHFPWLCDKLPEANWQLDLSEKKGCPLNFHGVHDHFPRSVPFVKETFFTNIYYPSVDIYIDVKNPPWGWQYPIIGGFSKGLDKRFMLLWIIYIYYIIHIIHTTLIFIYVYYTVYIIYIYIYHNIYIYYIDSR